MPLYEYRCLDCKKRSTILCIEPGQSGTGSLLPLHERPG